MPPPSPEATMEASDGGAAGAARLGAADRGAGPLADTGRLVAAPLAMPAEGAREVPGRVFSSCLAAVSVEMSLSQGLQGSAT